MPKRCRIKDRGVQELHVFLAAPARAFLCVLAAALSVNGEAFGDRIGGSNLPSQTLALKGRIAEGEGATSVAVVSTAVGTTTNAGPTFFETPSAFVDRGIG